MTASTEPGAGDADALGRARSEASARLACSTKPSNSKLETRSAYVRSIQMLLTCVYSWSA